MKILTMRNDGSRITPLHRGLAITYRIEQQNFAMYIHKARDRPFLHPIFKKVLIVLKTIKFDHKHSNLSGYYRFNLAIHLLLG
jgi:hypothetical protein